MRPEILRIGLAGLLGVALGAIGFFFWPFNVPDSAGSPAVLPASLAVRRPTPQVLLFTPTASTSRNARDGAVVGEPVLQGVSLFGHTPRALISFGGAKAIWISQNQQVGAWTLNRVEPARVELASPAGKLTLGLFVRTTSAEPASGSTMMAEGARSEAGAKD